MRHHFDVASKLVLCAAIAASACDESAGGLLVGERGLTPTADARVLGYSEHQVRLELSDSTLEVTLDASHSRDPDDRIVKYRWLSGTRSESQEDDAGLERAVPDGAGPDWPDDVKQPVVTLGEGAYAFTLWVIDERGNVSIPDTVTVDVGPPLDPSTQACLDTVAESANARCAQCVCGLDDTCRAAVAMSACGDTCWSLLGCISDRCPDFRPGGDTTCLLSQCTQFLNAGEAARALTPCLESCNDTCRRAP